MKKILLGMIILGMSAVMSTAAWAASKAMEQGKKIYETACTACHSTGVAGAPKTHDQKAWNAKLDEALAVVKEKNPDLDAKAQRAAAIKVMVGIVKAGKGAMPPKGMCPTCTDRDYTDAIKYMMSKP